VTTASPLAPGTYPLTITGTSGGLAHTASVSLVVKPPPDFALSITPTARSVKHGSSTSYTILVSPQGGFSGAVTLSVTGVPSAASATFDPSAIVGPGASTMTVKTGSKTRRGTYTLTVSGQSGAIVHQVTASLTVT
jgi:hypothetical protein